MRCKKVGRLRVHPGFTPSLGLLGLAGAYVGLGFRVRRCKKVKRLRVHLLMGSHEVKRGLGRFQV